jgi:hypothetical protein
MTTSELKNILIYRIAEIKDVSFLKALKTILDSKTETDVIQLTPGKAGIQVQCAFRLSIEMDFHPAGLTLRLVSDARKVSNKIFCIQTR